MSILNFIGDIITPVTDLIDKMHTSDAEKLEIKAQMLALQAKAYSEALEFEKSQMQAKADIIKAEAQGQSWMQRSWRPITMLTFLALVVSDSFGWLASPLAPQAWDLLQIGLGGYVVGRSLEKIAPIAADAVKERKA